jgi:hypothetical protein
MRTHLGLVVDHKKGESEARDKLGNVDPSERTDRRGEGYNSEKEGRGGGQEDL